MIRATHKIDFQPAGSRIDIPADATLLAAAQLVGVDIKAICGGIGVCGGCRVRLVTGSLTEPGIDESAELGPDSLAAGYRLACQARASSDARIEVPADSLTASQRLQLEAEQTGVELDPMIAPYDITLDPASLADIRSDATRVREALAAAGVPGMQFTAPVLAKLSKLLREEPWHLRVAVAERRAVAVAESRALAVAESRAPSAEPGVVPERRAVSVLPSRSRLLALAADLGTTKIAMYLMDLESGETLGALGAINPQIGCGEDVISRLAWADHTKDGPRILQQRVIDTLAEGITELCGRADAKPEQVVDAVVVGNTAMHHFFAGLPTTQLGVAPYTPVVTDALSIPARELGLPMAAGAEVHLPPIIAGFVGADHVAMLLAMDAHRVTGTTLALDIGTNTEMSLMHDGRIVSCSCPSGPAFEGAHLTAGMRAAQGAVEAVRITGNKLLVRTIDGRPAVGICGSGILDAVAEMLWAGMLDTRGNILRSHPLTQDGTLVLSPAPHDGSRRAIAVYRRDVMEIQLAKATIQSGIATLLAHLELAPEAIETVIIAGAFGSYLDIRSAIRIGMFPKLPQERFRQVGNAAGAGARQMLLSRERRRIAGEIARRAEYLELSTQPEFTKRYLKAIWL